MNIKLLKRIMEEGGVSVKELARRTKILSFILYFKLHGVCEFTLDEITRIAKTLNLSENAVNLIFFDKKVS